MWNCPIELQTTALELKVREAENQVITEAVRQIGVRIDEKGLVEALNHDRRRYEEAYQKGWNDCREYYEKKCQEITDILAEMILKREKEEKKSEPDRKEGEPWNGIGG